MLYILSFITRWIFHPFNLLTCKIVGLSVVSNLLMGKTNAQLNS